MVCACVVGRGVSGAGSQFVQSNRIKFSPTEETATAARAAAEASIDFIAVVLLGDGGGPVGQQERCGVEKG